MTLEELFVEKFRDLEDFLQKTEAALMEARVNLEEANDCISLYERVFAELSSFAKYDKDCLYIYIPNYGDNVQIAKSAAEFLGIKQSENGNTGE